VLVLVLVLVIVIDDNSIVVPSLVLVLESRSEPQNGKKRGGMAELQRQC